MLGWFKRKRDYPTVPLLRPDPVGVIISREKGDDQGTFGILAGPRGFGCHVLELPDRDNQSNISRIPAGTYNCILRRSGKFGLTFMLTDVFGRTYILVHRGNLAGDTEKGWKTHSAGCILLGKYRGKLSGQKAVMCSRPTVRKFMKLFNRESFTLEIKED